MLRYWNPPERGRVGERREDHRPPEAILQGEETSRLCGRLQWFDSGPRIHRLANQW